MGLPTGDFRGDDETAEVFGTEVTLDNDAAGDVGMGNFESAEVVTGIDTLAIDVEVPLFEESTGLVVESICFSMGAGLCGD